MWGVLGSWVQATVGSPPGAMLERFSLHPWTGSDPREATPPLPKPHTFTTHHLRPCKYITFHVLKSFHCYFLKLLVYKNYSCDLLTVPHLCLM